MLRIGHRGAAALAPANSLQSLAAAVRAGVDMVEVDVIAVDGRILLSHSARELAPDAPTLEEALTVLPPRLPVIVDLKHRGLEATLVETLRRSDALVRTTAATSDGDALLELRRLEPTLRRSLTYPRRRSRAPMLRPIAPRRVPPLLERVGASAATLQHQVVSRSLVKRCHDAGAAVYVWTVNDTRLVRWLAGLGVDGVITDDPGVFAGLEATLQA